MRIFLFACLLACNSAPEPACKCSSTTCTCEDADAAIPVCPSSASARGECTNEPACMGCDVPAGFSCTCKADDAGGHHWFCIGTGSSCANEP